MKLGSHIYSQAKKFPHERLPSLKIAVASAITITPEPLFSEVDFDKIKIRRFMEESIARDKMFRLAFSSYSLQPVCSSNIGFCGLEDSIEALS